MSRRNRKLIIPEKVKKDGGIFIAAASLLIASVIYLVIDFIKFADVTSGIGMSDVAVHSALFVLGVTFILRVKSAYVSALCFLPVLKFYLIWYLVISPLSEDPLMMFTEEHFFTVAGLVLFASAFILLVLFSFNIVFLKKVLENAYFLPVILLALSYISDTLALHFSDLSASFNDNAAAFAEYMPLNALICAGVYFYGRYCKTQSRQAERSDPK